MLRPTLRHSLLISGLLLSTAGWAATNNSFSAITVDGQAKVIIQGARNLPNPQIQTTQRGLPIKTAIRNQTLYIEVPNYTQAATLPAPTIHISAANLTALTLNHGAHVEGSGLISQGLTLNVHDSSSLNLTGVVNVKNINQTGNSEIYIRWVNSKTLILNSKGVGEATLAGVVNQFTARIQDGVRLRAQYLRAQNVQIQTTQQAQAYVCPIDTLQAFAADQSNIYYYKYPKNLMKNTTQSGNVLQMAWHN